MKSRTKKLAYLSVIIATALILSFVESRIPAFVSIPGIKVGLANIAVIFTLYKFGVKDAICVSLVRVMLVSLLFGTVMSLWYSLAGATLSFLVMLGLKKLTPANTVSVSLAGGISHNIGQILVACLVLETNVLIYYLPFLILSGVVAGIAVGLASALLIKKIKL